MSERSPGDMDGGAEQPPQRPRLCFPRRLRILRRADFQRIMKAGVRATDGRLVLWAQPNGRTHPRLGLTVGRQHGGAVQRNRLKRLLREAFRLQQHDLPPGLDLVCAPRVGAQLDRNGCQDSLSRLAAQLARRATRQQKENAE